MILVLKTFPDIRASLSNFYPRFITHPPADYQLKGPCKISSHSLEIARVFCTGLKHRTVPSPAGQQHLVPLPTLPKVTGRAPTPMPAPPCLPPPPPQGRWRERPQHWDWAAGHLWAAPGILSAPQHWKDFSKGTQVALLLSSGIARSDHLLQSIMSFTLRNGAHLTVFGSREWSGFVYLRLFLP